MPALLLDLDDTLVVEEPAAAAAFEATAALAATVHCIDAGRLALDARARARALWHAGPNHAYCERIGISSWEGLWCRFEAEPTGQDGDEVRALRAWSPAYRRESWRLALADQGVADDALANTLGERFGVERRARHAVFADAEPALVRLSAGHRLGLLTNGAACLQREKLAASGLAGLFEVVVISADVGVAKPDIALFRYALERLGAQPHETTMVGDSLRKDVNGALAAGINAIWVDRAGSMLPGQRASVPIVQTLADLPALLA
jgi:putative hydrolase of the HAD superfamily